MHPERCAAELRAAFRALRGAQPIVDRTVEIEFLDAGVEAFAFTFG